MQPVHRDDVDGATPIPDAASPIDAPNRAIVRDEPAAPRDADGTVDAEADGADSARPTREYWIVLGGDATD